MIMIKVIFAGNGNGKGEHMSVRVILTTGYSLV